MKTRILALLSVVLLSFSYSPSPKPNPGSPVGKISEKYTGPIIDMHIHSFREGNPLFKMTHPPTLRGETFEGVSSPAEQRTKTLEQFRKHNIVKAVVTTGESWYKDLPETELIGGAAMDVEALRKQHQENKLHVIAELAPFYEGILANDPRILPHFEMAQELGLPVGFHILPGGPNYGFHLIPEMLGGMRTYNANPSQLEEVIVKYPEVKIYIMHGGWPYLEDLKALMYAHPKVYIDVSVINWILPKEEFYSFIQSLIKAGFGNRIMFGSDQMVWPQVIGVAVETLNSANFLTMEQKEDIFYDNAAEFLGLEEEEIQKHKAKR